MPYKLTSHRKNIDQLFKEANLRYDMVFFLSKLRLIVTFLKFDSMSIDQFSYAIIFKDVFDYFGDSLGPKICLWSARRVVHVFDNIGDTLVAHTSSLSTCDRNVDEHL